MIICSNQRKETVLKVTLEDFSKTGFPMEPVCVFEGNIYGDDKGRNIDSNCLSLLKRFLKIGGDYLFYLEDDIIFNENLYHNIINWTPLKYNFLFLGSLYNCVNIPYFGHHLAYRRDNDYVMVDTCTVWGSQALVIRREAVEYLVENWSSGESAFPDIKIPRLIQRLYSVSFYHIPSLVQHQPTSSLFGLGNHQAFDFDKGFKK